MRFVIIVNNPMNDGRYEYTGYPNPEKHIPAQ